MSRKEKAFVNFHQSVIQLTENEVGKMPIDYLSLGTAERLLMDAHAQNISRSLLASDGYLLMP